MEVCENEDVVKLDDSDTEPHVKKRRLGDMEMKLREFDILDEINEEEDNGDVDGGGGVGSRAGGGDGSDHSDLSDDEVYNMLDEGLEKSKKEDEKKENGNFIENDKVVLVEKTQNHFEVLPDGWATISHNSGMPIYLHKQSRVCTLSKPYYLGTGSARKHEIPLSSIPCLEYRRAKDEEEQNDCPSGNTIIVNGTELPSATVETASENAENKSLTPLQVREYCERLFEFKTVKVVRFKSWMARRKYIKEKKAKIQRPFLPTDTKLITCPVSSVNDNKKWLSIKDWFMNPNGKSFVCILHGYVQRILKQQPIYIFKEIENAATPYSATVKIGDMQYGVGVGSSKKQAKLEAAKATLEIMIPQIKSKIDEDQRESGRAGSSKDQDLSFFDGIKIEDPRVAEFCAKTTEPSPHDILLTCLQRNYGLGETNIKCETNQIKHLKNKFTMTIGSHTATVICNNKRDGKQRASQAILQSLHPHIDSWGSLLRLYGNHSVKAIKAKKLEEQEITSLQSCAAVHSPNYAILNKLKEEMRKLKAMRNAVVPIGKFIPPEDVDLPASTASNYNDVQL